MKKYIIPFLAAGLLLAACDKEEGTPHSTISFDGELTPAAIVSPEDAVTINLDEIKTTTFQWSKPEWTGVGVCAVKVLFDKTDGDFSAPVKTFYIPSPEDSTITLSKDQMKEIHSACLLTAKGKESSGKWAVCAFVGNKSTLTAAQVINFKMTPDPDPFVAGNKIYVGGEAYNGAEATYHPEYVQHMTYIPSIDYVKSTAEAPHFLDNETFQSFDYEVFTKLEAGKTLYFWTGGTKDEPDWIIAPDAAGTNAPRTIVKDAEIAFTVPTTTIYRIRYSSSTGQMVIDDYTTNRSSRDIDGMSFRYWTTGNTNVDNYLTYKGNGQWKMESLKPSVYRGFKFLNFGLAGTTDQPYGCMYATKYNYGTSFEDTDAKYWFIGPVKGGAATGTVGGAPLNGTWTFPTWTVGKTLDVTVDMNDTYGGYHLKLDITD